MRKWLPFILSAAAVLVVGLDLLHVSILVLSSNARAVLLSMAVAGASIAAVLVLPSVALALVLRPFREQEESRIEEGLSLRSGVTASKPVLFLD